MLVFSRHGTNAHYVNTPVQYIEDMQMFWLNMVFILSVVENIIFQILTSMEWTLGFIYLKK